MSLPAPDRARMGRRREPTDLECLRAAATAYRLVERARPHVPERARRALGRMTPTEKRAALRGVELVDAALVLALRLR